MKPRILVLGGVGMVGRNFVKHCVDHDLCSYIRVADKSMPEISYFNPSHKAAFASDVVEYVQADLTRDAHVEKAFKAEAGPYDYVFNLAGETKCSLPEAVYSAKVHDLVAAKAQELDVKMFIEVSTAFVYKSQTKAPATEDAALDPWTLQAKFKLQAEDALRAMTGLNVVFVRPATIYGPGDVMGLMPRIVCAASYVQLQEKMKLLWDDELRVNTVHVKDVARALWHVATRGEAGNVYNLADKNDTSQGKLNALLGPLFGIDTGFIGKLISNLARLRLGDVVDDVNDKHMKPWSDLCSTHGVTNTPLTPYLDKELLAHHQLYINGAKIEAIGFEYAYPMLTIDELRDVIEGAIAQRIFPPILA
ncbi:hypothetical protein SPRG_03734 [Saprolegnia parasitica CBS 223.65]|uniref:NAD-dependent epimerase/dehydratase domain-containing protein n=1 Tax=Saprolegnia parasitica (strain CBS 223.65) TaxID=695850 RepID=A0A067CMA1_SAPPC|nr:hypothetical protein SPRG_03734 [Saprolegnia parasitica CBS 223.65]KDO31814.1 hypothetical protein SPRG_03734 [Saprolegnia parasitica CBS 223.65]|eukprot:XP_012197694.1 hypothetical protein SPRG_03734 [Saprolegnia parasitica CBS 223.65]